MENIFNISQKDSWNKQLLRLPITEQDIYYTPGYYQLYQSYGDGEALCYQFEMDDKVALYPFLKNPINELGYELNEQYFDIQGAYGYNGVISNSRDENFRKAFYEAFSAYCKQNNIVAEFTRFNPLLNNQEFSRGYLNIIPDRKVVFLDLIQTEDEIWDNYSSINRNMIRKALKNEVVVELAEKAEDYERFMEIYHENMNRVQADPYYYFDKEYFQNLVLELGDSCRLLVAKKEDEIVGGMILFVRGEYAHYHLSAQTLEGRRIAVNNLYLHEAIKLAKNCGCKKMHFGGGTTNNEKDPLLKFKANYSKTLTTFSFGTKVYNKQIYDEVSQQWQEKYPEKLDKYNKYLLKYRY